MDMRHSRVLLALATLVSVLLPTTGPCQLLPSTKEIQESLDRARPGLLKHLKQSRGDVLALVVLAAVHDGVPKTEPKFYRAASRLRDTVLRGTYGAALRLMVMADDPEIFGKISFEDRQKRVTRDVKSILHNRMRNGFTYRKRNDYPDLSNTQYAALGLRAAVSLGADIPQKIWLGMLKSTLKAQAKDGGFGYTIRQRRKKPYASMTVAGIAVLQVCRQNLPPDVVKDYDIDDALAGAWLWMKNNRGKIGRDNTLSCFYFHYGLERAAVLSDVEKVDGRDWYGLGARMLLEMQGRKDGSWRSSWEIRPGGLPGPGSPVDTAFAVLFLRRKFAKTLPLRYPRMGKLNAQSTHLEVETAARDAVRQGETAIPGILKSLRSPLPTQREAATIALRKFAGKDFGFDPKLDPSLAAEAVKSAERWWLKRNSGR